jgi:hypothetical protein
LYNSSNSASITDSLAQIYCGDFTGSVSPDTAPTKITVYFSWTLVADATTTPTIENNAFASTTPAILDLPDQSALVVLDGTTSPDASTTQTLLPLPAPEIQIASSSSPDLQSAPSGTSSSPAETPAPTAPSDTTPAASEPAAPSSDTPSIPAEPDTSNVQSLLQTLSRFADSLLPHAYAQTSDTATDTADVPPAPSDTASSSVASTSTADVLPSTEGVVEVLYSLDGSTWHSLGIVPRAALQSASFDIPLDGITTWDDLAHLQISVRTLSTPDSLGTLYLDGMTLSIEYKDSPQIPKPNVLPTLKDAEEVPESATGDVAIDPQGEATSTNVIFYTVNADDSTTYVAETTAHGYAPLSDYYVPGPPPGTYILIEYRNDAGTFDCNGLSAAECEKDPHFVQRMTFTVTADAASSTSETQATSTP